MPPSTMMASSPASSIDRRLRIAPGRSLPNARSQKIPRLLLAEPLELLADLGRTDPVGAVGGAQLLDGRHQPATVGPERVDEGARRLRGELGAGALRPLDQPRLEVLLPDLDLDDLADRVHELHQRRGRLAPLDHGAREDRAGPTGRAWPGTRRARRSLPSTGSSRRSRAAPGARRTARAWPGPRAPPPATGTRRPRRRGAHRAPAARPRAAGTRPRPTGGGRERRERLSARAGC